MDKIETELVVDCYIDCVRRSNLKERIAVGDRPNNHLGGNIAGRTRPIVDDKLLTESLRQRLSDQAPNNVGRDSVSSLSSTIGRVRPAILPPRWLLGRSP